jgi:hypothetical protein
MRNQRLRSHRAARVSKRRWDRERSVHGALGRQNWLLPPPAFALAPSLPLHYHVRRCRPKAELDRVRPTNDSSGPPNTVFAGGSRRMMLGYGEDALTLWGMTQGLQSFLRQRRSRKNRGHYCPVMSH